MKYTHTVDVAVEAPTRAHSERLLAQLCQVGYCFAEFRDGEVFGALHRTYGMGPNVPLIEQNEAPYAVWFDTQDHAGRAVLERSIELGPQKLWKLDFTEPLDGEQRPHHLWEITPYSAARPSLSQRFGEYTYELVASYGNVVEPEPEYTVEPDSEEDDAPITETELELLIGEAIRSNRALCVLLDEDILTALPDYDTFWFGTIAERDAFVKGVEHVNDSAISILYPGERDPGVDEAKPDPKPHPVVGTRVKILQDIERYPHGTAESGELGTIDEWGPDYVAIQLDKYHEGFDDWNNCVHFYLSDPAHVHELWQDVAPA